MPPRSRRDRITILLIIGALTGFALPMGITIAVCGFGALLVERLFAGSEPIEVAIDPDAA